MSRHEPLVLSFAQQRLWFLAQLDEGSTNYHIPLTLRLRGGLDRTAWQRSLDRFFARHEALRSVFVAPEGKPRVEVLPPDAGAAGAGARSAGPAGMRKPRFWICAKKRRARHSILRGGR
nr:condensation domain-containing protein [Neorhizobium galegae]